MRGGKAAPEAARPSGGSGGSSPRASTAIVGAGIVGCLIARQLAEANPDAMITVFDRDLAGSGVTRRSAGLFLARGTTSRTRRMSAFSHAYYADLKKRYPRLPVFPVAVTALTEGTADPATFGYLADLAAPAEIARPHAGLPGRWAPGQARNPPAAYRAWRIEASHYSDVHGVTQAIAELARPRVRFAEGVAVTGLTIGPGCVTVHCGTGEQLTVDQVVLAPGAQIAAPAWRDLLSPLGLAVKKIVAMHIEQSPGPADEVLMFDSDDAFLLPLRHRGHWLFSYTCTEWDVDPDKLTGGLTAANVEEARACLRRHSPALAQACTSGRVCADAYSPSREPVVSVLRGTQGRVVFAGAANGSGYRFGPAIAAQAVALLLGTEPIDGTTGPMDQTTSEGATDDHQHV